MVASWVGQHERRHVRYARGRVGRCEELRSTQRWSRARQIGQNWTASALTSPRVTLDWHSAKQEHRSHLSTFSCTLPDHGYFDDDEGFVCHDYPWELEVQDFIHGLRPPAHPPEFLLLGYDGEGLAAVLAMRVSPLDRRGLIQAVAVAQRVSGNGLAGEAIGIAERVMDKYKFRPDYLIEARIDPDNIAAQSAFTRAGYEHLGMNGAYQSWYRQP